MKDDLPMPGDRECAQTLALEKVEGALLALAAGDALGWPQEMPQNVRSRVSSKAAHLEFEQWIRRSGGRFQPYEEVINSGDYSDDTQLTLAIARSRTNHGPSWWKAFTRVELPLWTLYERGGGGATKRAANSWIEGIPPWKSSKRDRVQKYFDAGGNGVAMRVLPHSLFFAGQDDPATLMHDVVLDGSATHGHPRALLGANVYAYAAWSLVRRTATLQFGELLELLMDEASEWSRCPNPGKNGESWFDGAEQAWDAPYAETWHRITCEMQELLEKARKGIKAGALADDHTILKDLGCFGRTKGAGTSSSAAAVYLASRHAAQPTQGVLRAAFEQGADTDTLAAMVGGLLGCLSGVEWLPRPWLQVQDSDYIRYIASRLAEGPGGAHHEDIRPLQDPKSVFSQLLPINKDQEMILGNQKVNVTALQDPKPISKSVVVHAWRLTTAGGQTLFVNQVSRSLRTDIGVQPNSAQQNHGIETAIERRPAEAKQPLGDNLYALFCQRLRSLLESSDALKSKEIEDALNIVPSQTTAWLNRAQKEGWILQTSARPKRFTLCSKSLV